MIRRLTLVLLVLQLSCRPSNADVTVAMWDSAGIVIVENPAPDSVELQRWRLSESPLVEIGREEDDPGHQFSEVVNASRLSDGRIVIGDAQTKEIRFFSPSGAHQHSTGGPGEGPGEFRFLMSLDLLPGDTVVASGWPVGSLAFFDPAGDFVRSETVGPYWPGLLGRVLWDGSLLMDTYEQRSYGNEIEWWAAYGTEAYFRALGTMIRVHRGGEVTDTLREIMGEEYYKIGRIREDLTLHTMPFARTTLVTWTRDRIFVAETGSRQIEVRHFDGTLARLIRWPGKAEAVANADRGTFNDLVLGSLRRPAQRPNYERWLAAVPYPEYKPALQAMAADRNGHLWVKEWQESGTESERWIVFGAEGGLLAEVDVPRGLRLTDIGEDYTVAVWSSELDVESVRVYSLLK